MRFTLLEFSGGLGDLGTFIPLTFALSLVSGMDIGVILVFAGLFNITTGILFGLPIPVQPMKAIAAVAIAERLLPVEIAAAGLGVGAVLLVLGATGWIKRIERVVPLAVVRGIQLGIGLKLAIKGIEFVSHTPASGFDSITVALALGLVTLLLHDIKRFPTALLLFLMGVVITFISAPFSREHLPVGFPEFSFVFPDVKAWGGGLVRGALPQLPLTLLNSVLAVCVLSGDLFPGKKVSSRKMGVSVGIMNLLSCGFGAMPMCHGSGGLAGQYHFGARTGGSVVMLGTGKLLVGLLFGAATMQLLQFFPQSILGIMLLFAGIELALPARDQRHRKQLFVMLLTGVGILAVSTVIGFSLGMLGALALRQSNYIFHKTRRR